MPEPREFNFAHGADQMASVFSSAVNMSFADKIDVVDATNQYTIAAERAFWGVRADSKTVDPGFSVGHVGLFANDKDASDILLARPNGESATLTVVFKNSDAEIGVHTVSSIFTSANGKAFNPAGLVPLISVPDSFKVETFTWQVDLTAALVTALDAKDLYVGWVPK